MPTSSSVSSEVAAVEIAQPLPSKAISVDPSLAIEPDRHALLVAAEGVGVLELEVRLVDPPEVMGPLVVLEDLVAVELVHPSRLAERCNTLFTTQGHNALQMPGRCYLEARCGG